MAREDRATSTPDDPSALASPRGRLLPLPGKATPPALQAARRLGTPGGPPPLPGVAAPPAPPPRAAPGPCPPPVPQGTNAVKGAFGVPSMPSDHAAILLRDALDSAQGISFTLAHLTNSLDAIDAARSLDYEDLKPLRESADLILEKAKDFALAVTFVRRTRIAGGTANATRTP